MDVVAVSDVALISNTRDNTKATLKCLSKLVGGGLKRSSVEGIIDILCFLPLSALIVHVLHNLKCKWSCLFVGVAVTSHSLNTLVQACITKRNGGISAVKQRIDNLTLI